MDVLLPLAGQGENAQFLEREREKGSYFAMPIFPGMQQLRATISQSTTLHNWGRHVSSLTPSHHLLHGLQILALLMWILTHKIHFILTIHTKTPPRVYSGG